MSIKQIQKDYYSKIPIILGNRPEIIKINNLCDNIWKGDAISNRSFLQVDLEPGYGRSAENITLNNS